MSVYPQRDPDGQFRQFSVGRVVLNETTLLPGHLIDGKKVEAKLAHARVENVGTSWHGAAGGGGGGDAPASTAPTKKIFVGGLPSTTNEVNFREYFSQFGEIEDVVGRRLITPAPAVPIIAYEPLVCGA
jgi:hypothetical protein